jgi:hypothetical protein
LTRDRGCDLFWLYVSYPQERDSDGDGTVDARTTWTYDVDATTTHATQSSERWTLSSKK